MLESSKKISTLIESGNSNKNLFLFEKLDFEKVFIL